MPSAILIAGLQDKSAWPLGQGDEQASLPDPVLESFAGVSICSVPRRAVPLRSWRFFALLRRGAGFLPTPPSPCLPVLPPFRSARAARPKGAHGGGNLCVLPAFCALAPCLCSRPWKGRKGNRNLPTYHSS